MPSHDAIIAIYAGHDQAEAAIRRVAEAGLNMKHFSILGRGYHTEERVTGFYGTGDRIRFWGSRGAIWGGLWGLLFGGMLLTIPVLGPVMVLGPLSAMVFAAITGAVEGAVIAGSLGAIGGALASIGIPEHSVLQVEAAIAADRFVVLAHGPAEEVARAQALLRASGPAQIEHHAALPAPIPVATPIAA
jgi:hypothetical protein